MSHMDREDGVRVLSGFCETDITPSEPVTLVGFYRPDNLSRGILKPLKAQVCVWEDKERCCLITVDSIGFTKELSVALRKKIGRRLKIPPERVMLCFSHAHSAPDADAERGYFETLCARVEAAAARAAEEMQPVSVGWANAQARIGINRRPVSRDTDDRVGILKVCDARTGALKLLILRVTAHGNVLKRDNRRISPDYFGAVRDRVGGMYGCPVMMIQGAAGSTAPKYFCSRETPVDAQSPECIRSEKALEDMAEAVLSGISGMIGGIRTRPDCPMRMYSRHLELKSPVPSMDEARRIEEEARVLCGIENSGWIGQVAELNRAGISEQAEDVEIQYFRIGDWCLCGGPYEFMVGFALETQKRLKDEYFYMNGYTNGCLLYFPTEDEFDFGGYEVYWSMLIYYPYVGRVFPFRRGSADALIEFVIRHRDEKKS